MAVIATTEHADTWEIMTLAPANLRSDAIEPDISNFANLIRQKPLPNDFLALATSGLAAEWFLAFQDTRYLDLVGTLAIEEPGHPFIRTMSASASEQAMRSAYEALAEWLEAKDSVLAIPHLGQEFDFFDSYPTEVPYNVGHEINASIRLNVLPRKRVCILATMRNEGPYIIEWISYYKSIGIEKFFIYTNENEDGSDQLLNALAESGHITLIQNDARRARPQYKAYGHAFKALPHILDYEWALVVDADEFLVFDSHRFNNIDEYIDWITARPADAVAFNWVMYRSFGIETANLEQTVTRRFVKRESHIDWHIKSMVRPNRFVHAHPHYAFEARDITDRFLDSNGNVYKHHAEKALSIRPVGDAAWINHYWAKSAQEFCGKQARNGGDARSTFRRPLIEIREMLELMRQSDASKPFIEDHRIFSRLPQTETIAKQILSNPTIYAAHQSTIRQHKKHLEDLFEKISKAHVS